MSKAYLATVSKRTKDQTTGAVNRTTVLEPTVIYADDGVGASQLVAAKLNGDFDPSTMTIRVLRFAVVGHERD